MLSKVTSHYPQVDAARIKSFILSVKVPYLLHEPCGGEEKTSPDKVSGQENIMFQQWVGMRPLYETTAGIKRRRISE